jgi:hypothetical protein
MKKLSLVVYIALGAGAILYGVANLLFPALLVHEAAQSFPVAHILREQAAAAIFIGLMSLWCVFNYERRQAAHYFLVVLAFLVAAIHWFDFFAGHLGWKSPLLNLAPLIVLLIMTIGMRKASAAPVLTSTATYPPPGDLLSARQVEKLELEIKSLESQKRWEDIGRVMPIIATLIGASGFFFTVFVFTSTQKIELEKDRKSRDVEQKAKLQNQIRGDADELLHFTGDPKLAVSRAVFLLEDMNTVLDTELGNGQKMADEFRGYRRSLSESLMVLVRDDCDFNKNPRDVGLADAIASHWADYSDYLREKDFIQLEYILSKYIGSLQRFRAAYPGYLESMAADDEGGYKPGPKYENRSDQELLYSQFADLRDGIRLHLEILTKGDEGASKLKKTYVVEFERALCNPVLAKDTLGADFTNTSCR